MPKKIPPTPQVEKLRTLVTQSGGPGAFASKYSRDKEQPIDPTYVSQLLNGHRGFRDVARRNMAIRAGLPEDAFEITTNVVEDSAKNRYDITRDLVANLPADIAEVVIIMNELDSDDRRDILGAARAAKNQQLVRQQNPSKRAG